MHTVTCNRIDLAHQRQTHDNTFILHHPRIRDAGIYGMNFKHMPELDTPYGYFVVLGVIAVFCLLLFVRFKKAKWL